MKTEDAPHAARVQSGSFGEAGQGVTQTYLAMLESGAFGNPTLDTLRRLVKVLKVTVGKLVVVMGHRR